MIDPMVICVYKSGGDFSRDDVRVLAGFVRRHCNTVLWCLSDDPLVELVPNCKRIALRRDWPGWWSKMELFQPDCDSDMFYLDLDTVLLGDCRELMAAGHSTMLDDFYTPTRPASGLMYIAQGDKVAVWEAWLQGSPLTHMARFRGDQDFLGALEFGKVARRWQHDFPHQVISFKAHMRPRMPGQPHLKEPPSAAKVVCFHGKPRPKNVHEPWIIRAREVA